MGNLNKKFLLIFPLIILFMVMYYWRISSCENMIDIDNEKGVDIKFNIDRIEHSIKDDEGNILSYIYYDKPVLTGGREDVVTKINTFFSNDCDEWLNSVDRTGIRIKSTYNVNDFKDLSLENINNSGSDVIKEQPFKYLVDTKIILLNKKYISVLQIYNSMTMGPQDTFYYGSTFDLKTGELVAFDSICDFNAVSFERTAIPFLVKNLKKLNHNLSENDVESYYSKFSSFIEKESDIKYNYCFDGENFYLVNNETAFVHSGIIVKWNGEYNKESKISLLIYEKSKDDKNITEKILSQNNKNNN